MKLEMKTQIAPASFLPGTTRPEAQKDSSAALRVNVFREKTLDDPLLYCQDARTTLPSHLLFTSLSRPPHAIRLSFLAARLTTSADVFDLDGENCSAGLHPNERSVLVEVETGCGMDLRGHACFFLGHNFTRAAKTQNAVTLRA
jgi:hypothetical protein